MSQALTPLTQSPNNDPYYTHQILPEQRMIGAMIERAILDATGNCRVSGERSREKMIGDARRWIFNWQENDRADGGTFGWACDAIGVCPLIMQRTIRDAIKEGAQFVHSRPLHLYNCISPLEA